MDKHDYLLENFKNIQELIRFSDQKAGALLVVYGFLVTIFLEFIKGNSLVNPFVYGCKMIIIYLIGFCFIISMLVQIYYIVFKIILPQNAKHYKSKDLCYFYYGHIAEMNKTDFVFNGNKRSNDDLTKDILTQIYEVAKILKRKNRNLRVASICTLTSIGILSSYILIIKL